MSERFARGENYIIIKLESERIPCSYTQPSLAKMVADQEEAKSGSLETPKLEESLVKGVDLDTLRLLKLL